MRIVYISGPYRSVTREGRQANIDRAASAAIDVWQAGAVAICPHLNTAHFDGLCPDDVFLRGDLVLLQRSDALLALPTWKESAGAQHEVRKAQDWGIPVFKSIDEVKTWLGMQPGMRRIV